MFGKLSAMFLVKYIVRCFSAVLNYEKHQAMLDDWNMLNRTMRE